MWNDYKFRSRFFMVVIGAAGNPNIFYMNDCFLLWRENKWSFSSVWISMFNFSEIVSNFVCFWYSNLYIALFRIIKITLTSIFILHNFYNSFKITIRFLLHKLQLHQFVLLPLTTLSSLYYYRHSSNTLKKVSKIGPAQENKLHRSTSLPGTKTTLKLQQQQLSRPQSSFNNPPRGSSKACRF